MTNKQEVEDQLTIITTTQHCALLETNWLSVVLARCSKKIVAMHLQQYAAAGEVGSCCYQVMVVMLDFNTVQCGAPK